MLYNGTLLLIHPIYNSFHLLIPNSQSIPPPPLGNHKSLLYVYESKNFYFEYKNWLSISNVYVLVNLITLIMLLNLNLSEYVEINSSVLENAHSF